MRDSIIGSSLTLPLAAVLTIVGWMLPDVRDGVLWGGLAATLFATYLVMELNARFSLLRIRSRMMSATFLVLMLALPALHGWTLAALCPIAVGLGYMMLFQAYDALHPEGYVFHAFLFLAAAALCFPPFVFLGVGYLVAMLFLLRCFTLRTLCAAFFGLVVPPLFLLAWSLYSGDGLAPLIALGERAVHVQTDYAGVSTMQWTATGTLAFFTLWAVVHLFRTSYNDKIRTRVFLYVIFVMEVAIAALLVLMPQEWEALMRLFVFNSSFLLAHYYALARGRLFGLWFHLTLLAFVLLGIYAHFFPTLF